MARYPQIDRLKTWLDTSGVKQQNNALYQVIDALIDAARANQQATQEVASTVPSGGGGGGGPAITQLNTDVVAIGPGNVPAIIQPHAVTYNKIQQVVNGQRLLGSELALQDVQEIELGSDLSIVDGVLAINTPGGGSGLAHNFLSPTHPDTKPASPVIGDIVRAVEGTVFTGDYYGFVLNAPVVEDFAGIRFGYTFGAPFVGNYFGYAPPALAFKTVVPPDTLLAWEYIDFFLLSLLVEDFAGIRVGYTKFDYLAGNNFAYYPPQFTFVPPPTPVNPSSEGLWQRYGIGTEGQVLTVVDGKPVWSGGGESCPIPLVCPWVSVAFNAAHFTAAGGTTPGWTVDLADVIRWEYQVFTTEDDLNNSVRIALYLRETTVSGTAPTQLRVALPFSIVGKWAGMISLQENLAAPNNAFVAYDSTVNPNQLTIQKIPFGGAGTVPFDTTANGTFLSFEISAKVTGLAGCFLECGGGSGGSGGGVGPAGPQGEQGEQGIQGPVGPAGPAGADGGDLEYLGDYTPVTYNAGDIVVGTDGITYMCVKDGTSTPPEAWPAGAFTALPLHHTTHEPGGSDVIANVSWINVENTFGPVQNFTNGLRELSRTAKLGHWATGNLADYSTTGVTGTIMWSFVGKVMHLVVLGIVNLPAIQSTIAINFPGGAIYAGPVGYVWPLMQYGGTGNWWDQGLTVPSGSTGVVLYTFKQADWGTNQVYVTIDINVPIQ